MNLSSENTPGQEVRQSNDQFITLMRGKKLLGKGDDVRALLKQKKVAQKEITKQQDRLDKLKGRTNLTPAGKTARKKILDPKK